MMGMMKKVTWQWVAFTAVFATAAVVDSVLGDGELWKALLGIATGNALGFRRMKGNDKDGGSSPTAGSVPMGGLVLMALFLVGCAGPLKNASPEEKAQVAVSTASKAVDATDRVLAPIYEHVTDECRERTSDWDEYDPCVTAVDKAEAAVDAAHGYALAAQSIVDGKRKGSLADVLPCLYQTVQRLLVATNRVPGFSPPAKLTRARELLSSVASGGTCKPSNDGGGES